MQTIFWVIYVQEKKKESLCHLLHYIYLHLPTCFEYIYLHLPTRFEYIYLHIPTNFGCSFFSLIGGIGVKYGLLFVWEARKRRRVLGFPCRLSRFKMVCQIFFDSSKT